MEQKSYIIGLFVLRRIGQRGLFCHSLAAILILEETFPNTFETKASTPAMFLSPVCHQQYYGTEQVANYSSVIPLFPFQH